MKQSFAKFLLVETLILIAAVILLGITAFSYRRREIDVVSVNDQVQTVKEHWEDASFAESLSPETRIMVLGADGSLLYQSDTESFAGITSELDAIRKGMFCISVTDSGRYLGTIVIPNPAKEDFDHVMGRILWITAGIVIVIAISYGSFLWYVNRNIIRPFRRMKEFAAQIAQGRLDEPLGMEENNMFGLFTESFDIMREELRASKNREIALKLKERELVASLSHDLKTPVAGIRIICDVLQLKLEDAYVSGKIANIEQKTREIDTLLSDLLSSTLKELGEMNVKLCDLSSTELEEIVSEHDPYRKVKAGKVPDCLIRADRNRLSQVIGNIITNSYKYADTAIDVSYGFEDRFLKMSIRDHGKGVDPEELELLTNKFYRGQQNSVGKEGSGLGLYIAAGLMQKMQGQLICNTSEEGFEVILMIALS